MIGTVRELHRAIEQAGLRILSGSAHDKVYHGDLFITTIQRGSKPRERRYFKNVIADIKRRSGVILV